MKRDSAHFADVVHAIELQLQAIEIAGADHAFLECFRKVVEFLNARTDKEIGAILKFGHNQALKPKDDTEGEDFTNVSLERARRLLESSATQRKTLERLAMQRFMLSKGELSKLSNRGLLLERLSTLISNERTHEAIGRVASDPGRGRSASNHLSAYSDEPQRGHEAIDELLRVATQKLETTRHRQPQRGLGPRIYFDGQGLYSKDYEALVVAAQIGNGLGRPATISRVEVMIREGVSCAPSEAPPTLDVPSGYIWLDGGPLRLAPGEARNVAWFFPSRDLDAGELFVRGKPSKVTLHAVIFPDQEESWPVEIGRLQMS